jgi:hypothetical protein
MKLELNEKNMDTIERCIGFTLSIVGDHNCKCGRPVCGARIAQATVMTDIAELVKEMKEAGFEFTSIDVDIIPLGDDADYHAEPGNA